MSLENLSEEQRLALATTMQELLKHPEVSRDVKRLVKKVKPNVNFPELEIEDRIEKVREEEAGKRRELEDRLNSEKIATNREKIHQKLRDEGFDPEVVEKVMVEKKIADFDTAKRFVEMESKLAPPTPSSVTPMRMPDNFKDISKDPAKWAREQAHAAVNDIVNRRRVV